jgi:hypothetical protein
VDRLLHALRRARDLARSPWAGAEPDCRSRRTHVAIGDPQAPLETVLGLLDSFGLLGDDGRLRPDVALHSMGDHFDWGGAADVERASEDGLALLTWLASHPPDQVRLVLGNHDLARVGELADFDDASFREARALALDAYARGDDSAESELLRRFPALPTAEVAARDLASFTVAQRELVAALLRAKRFRIAFAYGDDVLLTHAGITSHDLVIEPADGARAVAAKLNARLDAALSIWTKGALAIPGLYEAGSASRGEGGGVFYHRPTSALVTPANAGRRFDPRNLPLGVTQVIGHIGDEKCHSLMPSWTTGAPEDGPLRTLVTDGTSVSYGRGVPARGKQSGESRGAEARLVFTDGAMRRAPVGAYEILDLERMAPFAPRAAGY